MIRKLIGLIQNSNEMTARRETLNYLLSLDDRLIEDAGFSKELLMKGIKAWPWRPQDDLQDQDMITPFSQKELSTAASTLRSFSDRDLNDLGIGRGEIGYVVKYGRPGYDSDRRLSAA